MGEFWHRALITFGSVVVTAFLLYFLIDSGKDVQEMLKKAYRSDRYKKSHAYKIFVIFLGILSVLAFLIVSMVALGIIFGLLVRLFLPW